MSERAEAHGAGAAGEPGEGQVLFDADAQARVTGASRWALRSGVLMVAAGVFLLAVSIVEYSLGLRRGYEAPSGAIVLRPALVAGVLLWRGRSALRVHRALDASVRGGVSSTSRLAEIFVGMKGYLSLVLLFFLTVIVVCILQAME